MSSSVRRASSATPPAAKPALRIRRTPAEGNGRDVRKSLETELSRLRSMFREILDNYATKVEGEITQLREVVAEPGGEGEREETLQAMLDVLRQVKLKPEKGRRRDIKRIHDIVQKMRRLTEAW